MPCKVAAPAPESSPRACPALQLPPEIWFMILNLLDYARLRKAARICKTIQSYTQDKSFDARLFRLGLPKPQLPEGEEITWHPMLTRAECAATSLDEAVIFANSGELKPLDYPATLKEYATAPASSLIVIDLSQEIRTAQPPTVSRAKGVTVLDVLKVLTRFWAKTGPRDMAYDAHLALGEYSPGLDKITLKDCKGARSDHVFWEGNRRPREELHDVDPEVVRLLNL
ncbi:hypothetical protein JCM10212_002288 [Sporobolomyces blumeae]